MSTNTKTTAVTYVGESRGVRGELRRRLARHFGIPASAVRFHECRDFEAESEIARLNIGWAIPGHVNVTFLGLGEIEHD
jgi:hypothetical protein